VLQNAGLVAGLGVTVWFVAVGDWYAALIWGLVSALYGGILHLAQVALVTGWVQGRLEVINSMIDSRGTAITVEAWIEREAHRTYTDAPRWAQRSIRRRAERDGMRLP